MAKKTSRPQKPAAACRPRRPAPVYGPVALTVELTAEQHAALVQIHSVVNREPKGWPIEAVLSACISFTADYLSLPVPASAATMTKEAR